MRRLEKIVNALRQPIPIAPLVLFRIAFGAVMLWEVWRYFEYDRIARYYTQPTFFFHYYGFEWVRPLPEAGMFLLFYALGGLALLILLGAFYRLSMTLFWIAFTYIFLLDQAQYLNHFYLISLISFLMIFVPCHRALSVDAWMRPLLRANVVPNWALWLLRGQMTIVYIYGGIAKINPDWLRGEPMREWLAARTDFPLIGHLFTQEWLVYLFSYGGLLLDLFIVPLLLWRRTRIPAFLLVTGFHITNSQLFNIGIFPWFSIAITALFLPPEWFVATWLRIYAIASRSKRLATPHLEVAKDTFVSQPRGLRVPLATFAPLASRFERLANATITLLLIAFFIVQVLLPLRHFLYPGYVSWTEEGHTLAWHMKLRSKAGELALFAANPTTGIMWHIPLHGVLSQRQYEQMKDNPDMILRLAQYLSEQYRWTEGEGVEIYAWSMMALNGRAPQLLIDPTANLAQQADTLHAADWILPLAQPPAPAATQPTLLISRRAAGVMALVNVTDVEFPLATLRLRVGEMLISGVDFGIGMLPPGGCAIAHRADANTSRLFTPCNEDGQRLVADAAFWDSTLHIWSGEGESSACDGIVCLVQAGEQERMVVYR
jgi:vitamin K-dependent gamma-carboxylase